MCVCAAQAPISVSVCICVRFRLRINIERWCTPSSQSAFSNRPLYESSETCTHTHTHCGMLMPDPKKIPNLTFSGTGSGANYALTCPTWALPFYPSTNVSTLCIYAILMFMLMFCLCHFSLYHCDITCKMICNLSENITFSFALWYILFKVCYFCNKNFHVYVLFCGHLCKFFSFLGSQFYLYLVFIFILWLIDYVHLSLV